MSLQSSRDDAARWQQWQQANAIAGRRSAMHARIFALVMFAGVAGWLALELLNR